jgi:hypothetical protein
MPSANDESRRFRARLDRAEAGRTIRASPSPDRARRERGRGCAAKRDHAIGSRAIGTPRAARNPARGVPPSCPAIRFVALGA